MVCAQACTIAVGQITHGNSEKNVTALCEDDIVGVDHGEAQLCLIETVPSVTGEIRRLAPHTAPPRLAGLSGTGALGQSF